MFSLLVGYRFTYEKLLVKQLHEHTTERNQRKKKCLNWRRFQLKWLGSIKCIAYQGKRAISITYGPEQSTISRYSYTYFIPGTPIIRHFYFSRWHGVTRHQATNHPSSHPTERPTDQTFVYSKAKSFQIELQPLIYGILLTQCEM